MTQLDTNDQNLKLNLNFVHIETISFLFTAIDSYAQVFTYFEREGKDSVMSFMVFHRMNEWMNVGLSIYYLLKKVEPQSHTHLVSYRVMVNY